MFIRPIAAAAALCLLGTTTAAACLLGTTAACLLGFSAASQAAEKPSDPQIAHIVYTADMIDIQAAQQAIKKSKSPQIVSFAKDMIRDHEAVNKQALALAKTLHVTPEDNATSQALTKAATAERATLASLHGKAFDKAYIDNEVAYHKQVDGALETVLIPAASNAQLKSLLETGLKLFQGHEQHAEHVAASFK